MALIGEKGKEKSDFCLCKNDLFARSLSAVLLVLNVFVIGLLFDWGNLMVLIWELLIQLSCLLFFRKYQNCSNKYKVDCFDVQSQVLEYI